MSWVNYLGVQAFSTCLATGYDKGYRNDVSSKKSNLGRLGTVHPSPGRPCPPLFISSLAKAAPLLQESHDDRSWSLAHQRCSVESSCTTRSSSRHQVLYQSKRAGEWAWWLQQIAVLDNGLQVPRSGRRESTQFSNPPKGKRCEGRPCALFPSKLASH